MLLCVTHTVCFKLSSELNQIYIKNKFTTKAEQLKSV